MEIAAAGTSLSRCGFNALHVRSVSFSMNPLDWPPCLIERRNSSSHVRNSTNSKKCDNVQYRASEARSYKRLLKFDGRVLNAMWRSWRVLKPGMTRCGSDYAFTERNHSRLPDIDVGSTFSDEAHHVRCRADFDHSPTFQRIVSTSSPSPRNSSESRRNLGVFAIEVVQIFLFKARC
jgi:hypothetical protein